MKIITDIDEMKEFSRNLKKASKKVAFVPTMGKLHSGHKKLVEEAKKYGETVVSIFVNPLQFAPNEDFDKFFMSGVKFAHSRNESDLFRRFL